MISILSVNYNSYDWATLLIESAKRFSKLNNKIVIVENTRSNIQNIPYSKTIFNPGETTHGEGINLGLKHIDTEYVLILDIDCHFIAYGWELILINTLKGETSQSQINSFFCVSVPGPAEKPLRPACVFMRAEDALHYDWRATPGYKGHRITPTGFDVGIQAYRQMVKQNKSIYWMTPSQCGKNRYGTITGEEYSINSLPMIYHHWHGTHLKERNKVDYKDIDLLKEKELLFKMISWRQKPKMI